MRIQILHNGKGSGDRTEILVAGHIVFDGTLPNPQDLIKEFEKIEGATEIVYHSVTDDELDNRGYLLGES